ncbi:MAG: DUF4493 domain-containing protein [Candidatus Cryptobacteroides sp.]|nr:DUF4493 domain-containing protein [Rikenellaceae bacterium]MDY5745954.1 DUF4493 domain-containing protein [Candidatus Cryptobacteroides sp.]
MKTRRIFSIALAALCLVSCVDDKFDYNKGEELKGTLSLSSLDIEYSEEMITTKADQADNNYMIYIYDSADAKVWEGNYGSVKDSGDKISLLAGEYTMSVRSSTSEVPDAKFSAPVYGASLPFSITAGETTTLETITCTLLQCAVTVGYNDDFLAMVTGDGAATVEVTAGAPLSYALTYNNGTPRYDRNVGYFAVKSDESTMTVTFKGSIENKTQKMTTTVTGVKARSLHVITFMKKVDESGSATIGVEIDGLVADIELTTEVPGNEVGDGNDPNAPIGDGGIRLESTCEYDITAPVTVPASGAFNFTMNAIVPNGVLKFTVDIASTNENFMGSVATVGGSHLDLINPSKEAMGIFDIVPFPHGSELSGQTSIAFDLSNAQTPLLAFPGTHTFTMNVTDKLGCKNSIDIVLVVE